MQHSTKSRRSHVRRNVINIIQIQINVLGWILFFCGVWCYATSFPVTPDLWIFWFGLVKKDTSIMKSQRSSAGIPPMRKPASTELRSASVELCETDVCFLRIQPSGTNVRLPKCTKLRLMLILSLQDLLQNLNLEITWIRTYFCKCPQYLCSIRTPRWVQPQIDVVKERCRFSQINVFQSTFHIGTVFCFFPASFYILLKWSFWSPLHCSHVQHRTNSIKLRVRRDMINVAQIKIVVLGWKHWFGFGCDTERNTAAMWGCHGEKGRLKRRNSTHGSLRTTLTCGLWRVLIPVSFPGAVGCPWYTRGHSFECKPWSVTNWSASYWSLQRKKISRWHRKAGARKAQCQAKKTGSIKKKDARILPKAKERKRTVLSFRSWGRNQMSSGLPILRITPNSEDHHKGR